MFCPNCGKAEQAPDSYCRSCGEFLTDYSVKSYIFNKLLGGGAPRKQVRLNLVMNAVTFMVSVFLLGFLNGHYDAQFDRTGERPPGVIYLVYVFLGLVILWQLLGIVINLKLMKKLDAGRKGAPSHEPSAVGGDLPSRPTQRSLPQGGFGDSAVNAATEHTTRSLDEVPRRRTTSQDLR